MSRLEKQIIDFDKLQKLVDKRGCSRDDLFEWTDLGPMEFMAQIGAILSFDVEEFLKIDIKKLDFDKIMTDKGLLKKISTLHPKYRSIENAINLELGEPLEKKDDNG